MMAMMANDGLVDVWGFDEILAGTIQLAVTQISSLRHVPSPEEIATMLQGKLLQS